MLRLAWKPRNVVHIYIKIISNPGPEYPIPSTNTRDGLEVAKIWLAECQTQHRCCKPTDCDCTTNMLPTRLLDLRTDEVRLCLGIDIGVQLEARIKYATLSHCWGSGEFLTLKNDNLRQFLIHIPLDALPRTFRDAIYIARCLGLQYLWIDSLCIIQDNANDWEREAALMSSVYGNSSINIAASGASDGSQGCFFERPETWRCLLKGESGALTQPQTLVAFANGALRGEMVNMLLSKRGWAVQERVLPRRTLFFTQKEVFWECDALGACESFPDGCPQEPYDSDTAIGLKKRPMTLKNWDNFIRLYTSSNLTMSKDKLVAISGIAQALSEEIGDEYVGGLWWRDLEHQLLWKNLYSTTRDGFRLAGYRAPTWPWASIDCVIDLEWYNTQPLMISFHDISIKYLTPVNSFGAVLSGTLRIRCSQLIRASIRRNPPSIILAGQHEALNSMCAINFDAKNDAAEDDVAFTEVFILPIVYVERWRKDCLLMKVAGSTPRAAQKKVSKFFSLPFLGGKKGKVDEQAGNSEEQARKTRQYQRIGRASISIDWYEFEERNNMHAAGYAAKDEDYSEVCVDKDGEKVYFVDII